MEAGTEGDTEADAEPGIVTGAAGTGSPMVALMAATTSACMVGSTWHLRLMRPIRRVMKWFQSTWKANGILKCKDT
jgi:hypothetical protein